MNIRSFLCYSRIGKIKCSESSLNVNRLYFKWNDATKPILPNINRSSYSISSVTMKRCCKKHYLRNFCTWKHDYSLALNRCVMRGRRHETEHMGVYLLHAFVIIKKKKNAYPLQFHYHRKNIKTKFKCFSLLDYPLLGNRKQVIFIFESPMPTTPPPSHLNFRDFIMHPANRQGTLL